MKLIILGTEYTVTVKSYQEEPAFAEMGIVGYSDSWSKEIVICDYNTHPNHKDDPQKTKSEEQKATLRHEIVHSFFSESGLKDCSFDVTCWAKNEEMVDWIALQGPKIYKAWQEAGAL